MFLSILLNMRDIFIRLWMNCWTTRSVTGYAQTSFHALFKLCIFEIAMTKTKGTEANLD